MNVYHLARSFDSFNNNDNINCNKIMTEEAISLCGTADFADETPERLQELRDLLRLLVEVRRQNMALADASLQEAD